MNDDGGWRDCETPAANLGSAGGSSRKAQQVARTGHAPDWSPCLYNTPAAATKRDPNSTTVSSASSRSHIAPLPGREEPPGCCDCPHYISRVSQQTTAHPRPSAVRDPPQQPRHQPTFRAVPATSVGTTFSNHILPLVWATRMSSSATRTTLPHTDARSR